MNKNTESAKLCFVDRASLYNLVNKANLVNNLATTHKQNKHINIRTIKFGNAKQAKQTHQYKNIKKKLYKTNAEIWYNKMCRQTINTQLHLHQIVHQVGFIYKTESALQ